MSKNPREVILKKIEEALEKKSEKKKIKPDFSKQIYVSSEEDLSVQFAQHLTQAKGTFFYCENIEAFQKHFITLIKQKNLHHIAVWEEEILKILPSLSTPYLDKKNTISQVEIGITSCECLIARIGGLLFSSKQTSGRSLSIYPPIHFVVAFASQLVYDIQQGLDLIQKKYTEIPSMICLTTGPSRTADIEKTLVLGAHGPKELTVFLIDDTLAH